MQNPVAASSEMELRSLLPSSSPLTAFPTSPLFRSNFVQRRFLYSNFIKFPSLNKYPVATSFQKSHISSQLSSGPIRFSSSAVETTVENFDSELEDVVFVAGATGKVGSRTVRELLKLGCRVRAGVRSAQRAESLVQSVKQMKLDTDATSGRKPIEMLEIVECDLEKPGQIVPALVKVSVVICCIGASEKEIFDVTGPYRIDFLAIKNLIEAATVAKVNHFILLTSLGTNKFGFPAAVLNLFWGVLCWKRKAEEALISSGLPFTIVRPGGMERPTDSYKETHNLTLSTGDTLFGGQVSNLQVAELLAFMAQKRSLSYCKIVEVVAETTAPLTPMDELLVKIPSERGGLQEPEIPDAPTTPGASPKNSLVTEAASIVKEKPSDEKVEVQDSITKPLDAEPAKSLITEVPTDLTAKKSVQDKSILGRPLSPYTMYEDLKPPSSPCPIAPNGPAKPVEADSTERDTPSIVSSISETETSTAEIPETVTMEVPKMKPLSPYAMYEDLKPPSSPCPIAPNGPAKPVEADSTERDTPSIASSISETETSTADIPETVTMEVPKMKPLSPYAVYEDLKPPSSPSPSPPASNSPEESSKTSKIVDGVPVIDGNGTLAEDIEEIFFHSPFPVYEDLKPPTSPTPTAPNSLATSLTSAGAESQMTSVSNNDAVEPVEAHNEEDEKVFVEPKPRPLSPYTMYDDMKPPRSPRPSSGNQ